MFFFFVVVVCLQAQTLSWEIKFLKGKAEESVPVSQVIGMGTGEQFLITILSEANAFCYVVCYDSKREVVVLHNQPVTVRQELVLGPYATEDPPGTETMYVIMSMERLSNLEGLIQSFNANANSKQHANAVYREVVSLQNKASKLGEPASSYIPSGGTTRGLKHATKFSGMNLYVRAIVVRH